MSKILAIAVLLATAINCLPNVKSAKFDALTNTWKVNDAAFTQLFPLTAADRNFSVVLLATALEARINCEPCHKFDPDFKLVAASYRAPAVGSAQPTIYFAVMDFADAPQSFQRLTLQNAPVIFYFPPRSKASAGNDASGLGPYTTWDGGNLEPAGLIQFISAQSNQDIVIRKPFNYTQFLTNAALAILALVCVRVLFLSKLFRAIISNHLPWTIFTLIFSLTMSTGYMWNQIRGAPYAGPVRDGKAELIMPNFQGQYQVESQIILVLYGLLSCCMIFLGGKVAYIQNANLQRLAVYLALGFFVAVFSVLIYVFRMKSGDYPFRLLL